MDAEKRIDSESWIVKTDLELSIPSLNDNTADADRLLKGLKKKLQTPNVTVSLQLVKRLPHLLRKHHYHVSAVLYKTQIGWHVIDVVPLSPSENSIFGLAMDLGSTTVVVRLVDMESHETKAETTFHNPQIEIGPDILTRIHYAARSEGLAELQTLLLDRLNLEIKRLAERLQISVSSIVAMSLAGNTTMTHLFLGIDPYMICREPYIPGVNSLDVIRSGEFGLQINPEAPVLVSPNVGSYFGGDLIAGILASGMGRQNDVSFLIDVGTNAEVVIGNRDWLMACAGAAGPALEGGVAGMGMMAGPGVIDKVIIEPDSLNFEITTINGLPPVGICGSGLIDLTAQLFLAGMIDLRAKFVESRCGNRFSKIDGIDHLIVVPARDSGTGQALTISQPDIDALVRSKAAMYTILTTISNTVNIAMTDIARYYVAGTFGTFIDPRSAITIGMIPDRPLETYVPLGNTSLEGATMALLSLRSKNELFEIRDRITYIELNVNQEFMNLFSAAKFLPHTDKSLFPSVKVKGA